MNTASRILTLMSVLTLSSVASASQHLADESATNLVPAFAVAADDWISTSEQAAVWQDIQQARQTNIRRLLTILDETQAALNPGADGSTTDLPALARTTEAAMDALILEMRRNRDRYLNLYTQLDPEQQTQAQEDLQRGLKRLRQLLGLLALSTGEE